MSSLSICPACDGPKEESQIVCTACFKADPKAPTRYYHDPLERVLAERKEQHGDFKVQFECAQGLKRILKEFDNKRSTSTQHEALDQICHKLSRIVTGDPTHADHWRDIAGYATLIMNMLEGK